MRRAICVSNQVPVSLVLFPARVAASGCRSGIGNLVLAHGTENARVDLIHLIVRLPEVTVARAYSAVDEAFFFNVPLYDVMDIWIVLLEQAHKFLNLFLMRPPNIIKSVAAPEEMLCRATLELACRVLAPVILYELRCLEPVKRADAA